MGPEGPTLGLSVGKMPRHLRVKHLIVIREDIFNTSCDSLCAGFTKQEILQSERYYTH